jgi:hypothetical protein
MSTDTTTQTTTTEQQTQQVTPPKTYTQAEVDAMLQERLTGAIRKATGETKAQLETELTELRSKVSKYEQTEAEKKGDYTKALQAQEKSIRDEYAPKLKAHEDVIAGLTGKLRDRTVSQVLIAAAAGGNAHAPKEVAALLDRYIKLDDKFDATVVDATGAPRFINGQAMTPDQLVSEYLQQHPHHVKAAQTDAGGGAAGGAARITAEAGEIELLEKQVKALDEEYKKTRNAAILTRHRDASNKLRALKAKKAA